jgi:uncharacterized protein YndB with AHSA1/START domain
MKIEDAASREIAGKPVVDAPRDLVWTAWTDPAQLSRWWGPTKLVIFYVAPPGMPTLEEVRR